MQSGRLEIYREIGDCYKHQGKWSECEAAYLEAIAFEPTQLDRIHLAEALLYQK
jgi:Tetratricopeptide repeat